MQIEYLPVFHVNKFAGTEIEFLFHQKIEYISILGFD